MTAIGIDLVETSRMREILSKDSSRFLANTFSERERAYCESFADPAPHYAGTFAAKEALRKATGALAEPFSSIEIIRTKEGKPEAWRAGKKDDTLLVSITHTDLTAAAVALKQ